MGSHPLRNRLGVGLLRDTGGGPAVEFALLLPLLLFMLVGFIEAGRYIEHLHIVSKAVRDGARYAARQDFADFACDGGAGDPTLQARIANYVRTGTATGAGTARLPYWDDPATIDIDITCDNASTGIYDGLVGGAPVVEIGVELDYLSLFGGLSRGLGLSIFARQQAAVVGA